MPALGTQDPTPLGAAGSTVAAGRVPFHRPPSPACRLRQASGPEWPTCGGRELAWTRWGGGPVSPPVRAAYTHRPFPPALPAECVRTASRAPLAAPGGRPRSPVSPPTRPSPPTSATHAGREGHTCCGPPQPALCLLSAGGVHARRSASHPPPRRAALHTRPEGKVVSTGGGATCLPTRHLVRLRLHVRLDRASWRGSWPPLKASRPPTGLHPPLGQASPWRQGTTPATAECAAGGETPHPLRGDGPSSAPGPSGRRGAGRGRWLHRRARGGSLASPPDPFSGPCRPPGDEKAGIAGGAPTANSAHVRRHRRPPTKKSTFRTPL